MSESDFPIPPPSFDFLILNLRMQAEVQLGLLKMPGADGPEEPNLPLAQHSIDLMAMLLEKTRGNLDLSEKRLLENSLTELRFRYVQVSTERAKPEQADKAEA